MKPSARLTAAVLTLTLCACNAPSPEGPPAATPAIFLDVTAATGLDFSHFNGMSGEFHFPEIQGPGGALFDYDNYGDLDLYLVQGQFLGAATSPEAVRFPPIRMPLRDRLYRNDLTLAPDGTRQLRFVDVTEASGLDARGYGMGVATGDYDNDGWVDLYLTQFGSNQLWRNNGDGTFSDVTASSGTDERRWSHSASFFDYDQDGWLDLFVVNYVDFRIASHRECPDATGAPDYCGPLAYRPEPDSLFRNRGDGTFARATVPAGVGKPGNGLGVVTADFDGDGRTDIYVANDAMPNHMWMKRSDGRFRDEALLRGTAVNSQGRAEASMGVDAGDADGDGNTDLFMTHLREETNTLYLNDGRGFFFERTASAGLSAVSMGATGFGTAFLDYDNDGWLDLVVVNGAVRAVQALVQQGHPFPYGQHNQLFRNTGGKFTEVTGQSGFSHLEVSRGVAVGDLDNDGDPDLLVTNACGPARVYLNRVGSGSHWLGLRLTGAGGRDMVGARVALVHADGGTLWRRARADASYLSASDPRILFGLGAATTSGTIRVRWPSGRVEEWHDLGVDRYVTLAEGDGRPSDEESS